MNKHWNGIPWTLAVMLAAALFVALQSRSRWKESAADEKQRSLYLLERVAADSCFMAGEYDEAFARYGGVLLVNGDSTLWTTRKQRMSALSSPNAGTGSTRKELEERLFRTERLLSRYKGMEADLARRRERLNREERQLQDVYGERLNGTEEELASMRKELENIRATRVLRFPNEKKGATVIYLGEVENDKANGQGFGVWSTGSTYEGEWKDNLRHGYGEFSWQDGEHFSGHYQHDLRNGFGIYHWKNGQRWEGNWKDDMRHGDGVLYEANGKERVRGTWELDKLKVTVKNGK
ncbi:MAG: hypothetical protein KF905_08310 [Flavobacteriales bacterium]|nr:hypothetical protein [Flavobacteriales bacterium]